MRQFVFQQRRTRNGEKIKSRIWSGEYMLEGDSKPTRVNLKTSDERVAVKRLAEIVTQAERERANLVLPKTLVAAAAKPVEEHIADYLRDLTATGRSKEYTRQVRARLDRMRTELGWTLLKDMTPDGFIAWRDALSGSPRTKNHFHDAVRGFVNWLVAHRRTDVNLFENLKRAQIPKGSRGNHRSFTLDELRRLLSASPPERQSVYLLAATSGLRRAELRRLVWQDMFLDHETPHIHFPGSSSKNKMSSVLELTDEAVRVLRELRSSPLATGPVFAKGIPNHHTFDADLAAAGIPKHDHFGRPASFHTFRRSLNSILHQMGVPRRVIMSIMRHSSPELSDHIYMDAESLPRAEAIRNLPPLLGGPDPARTEMRTDDLVVSGRDASPRVAADHATDSPQVPENGRHGRKETGSDATCQNPSNNGAGGNRTPVPRQSARRFYACSRSFDLGLAPGIDALCFGPAA